MKENLVEITCVDCGAFKLVRCKSSAMAGALRANLVGFLCPKCRKRHPEHVDVLAELVSIDAELGRKEKN